ncbi:hypothetical protein [Tepidiforma sp.]|uniref:hypothetical protein n=1 Tax=Tepidiforma sp. TaxID=2682230 RepID=UPI002ADDAF5F|nr:hypothetical protein [Tepidiforma sp.]
MCTQLAVDGEEIPTSPGKPMPVTLPSSERAVVRIPLSKTAFAREFHLWRMKGKLPCASEAEAFEVARRKVTTKYGAAQVMWFHSAFGKGYIAGVTRFAEKNPDFDPSRPANEETNPFFLWFDAPEGLVVPIILSVDTFRWNPKRQEGLRVVANILTRDAGVIVPPEIHGREPFFMRAEDWLGGELPVRRKG